MDGCDEYEYFYKHLRLPELVDPIPESPEKVRYEELKDLRNQAKRIVDLSEKAYHLVDQGRYVQAQANMWDVFARGRRLYEFFSKEARKAGAKHRKSKL